MPNARVRILLQHDEFVETVWAERVGADRYRLENSPFWAYGVSWRDVVEAQPDPDGQLRMTRVVEKAGHRTVRVIFEHGVDNDPAGQAVLNALRALGCSWEGMNTRYMAIDLPPEVDLATIAQHLTTSGVQWEHADPRYDEPFPGPA